MKLDIEDFSVSILILAQAKGQPNVVGPLAIVGLEQFLWTLGQKTTSDTQYINAHPA